MNDKHLEIIRDLRAQLHDCAEVSGQEVRTKALLKDFLSKNTSLELHDCGDGFYAAHREANPAKPAIALRGDYDALATPDGSAAHLCGHDGNAAVLCGAALYLEGKTVGRNVFLLFQPAEETVGGADDMIKRGCMSDPEVRTVFGFHIAPTDKVGTVAYLAGAMNAAVTDFELTVRGRSCHGAHPEQGIDSIVAAAGIVTALQAVPSRRFSPTTPTIVTIGTINGGTAGNVVAGEVKLTGTLRALDEGVMTDLKKIVRTTCENTAQGFGATAEINYTTEYPVLKNDAELTESTVGKIKKLIGKENVLEMDAPSLGADDFAFFCRHARCFYFNVGCRGASQGDEQVLHSSLLAPDEDSLRIALEILCAIV